MKSRWYGYCPFSPIIRPLIVFAKATPEWSSAEFSWAKWDSDEVHLPEPFHTDPKLLLSMMKYLNSWRKEALHIFADVAKLEARLLFVALWHRDMHLILFDEDVGTSAIPPPNYFVSSQFTQGHFDMVTSALASIASNIPIEGESAPQYESPHVTKSTETQGAADINDSISSAPMVSRPRPRQKPHPRAVSNILSCQISCFLKSVLQTKSNLPPAPTPASNPAASTSSPPAPTSPIPTEPAAPPPAIVRDSTPPPPKRRSKRQPVDIEAVVAPKPGRGGRKGGGRKKV